MPELILKTLSQVDADRHKGKPLAYRIIQRSKSADNIKGNFDNDFKPKNPYPEDPGEYDNPYGLTYVLPDQ